MSKAFTSVPTPLIDQLRRAVDFNDRCKRDPRAAEVGALRDAWEWSRELIAAIDELEGS